MTIAALADALGCSKLRAKEWLNAKPEDFGPGSELRQKWMGGKAAPQDDTEGSWSNVVKATER